MEKLRSREKIEVFKLYKYGWYASKFSSLQTLLSTFTIVNRFHPHTRAHTHAHARTNIHTNIF